MVMQPPQEGPGLSLKHCCGAKQYHSFAPCPTCFQATSVFLLFTPNSKPAVAETFYLCKGSHSPLASFHASKRVGQIMLAARRRKRHRNYFMVKFLIFCNS